MVPGNEVPLCEVQRNSLVGLMLPPAATARWELLVAAERPSEGTYLNKGNGVGRQYEGAGMKEELGEPLEIHTVKSWGA